jgi:hypothetical protein
MALDPKTVLLQNKILIGLYVVALVPVVLWFMLVADGVEGGASPAKGPVTSYDGAYSRLRQVQNSLKSYKTQMKTMRDERDGNKPFSNPLYTNKFTEAYSKQNQELDAQNKLMAKLITDSDAPLEKWFSDPKITEQVNAGKDPSPGDFDAVFQSEIGRLTKEYADLVVDPGPTKTSYLWKESVAPGTQRTVQKKFWVQERILMALKKGGAQQLLDRIDLGTTAPADKTAKALVAPIPAKFIFKASFRDLPNVIRELLVRDIVFRVNKVHTELLPFGFTRKESEGFDKEQPLKVNAETNKSLYDRTIYSGTIVNTKLFTTEEAILPEPALRVSVEVEALDFDTDAINAAGGGAPAPADAGKGK